MEQEYNTFMGVNFVQTLDAPLNHVKIHPLVFADLLTAITKQSDGIVDIYIRKGPIPEITLEEKIAQINQKG